MSPRKSTWWREWAREEHDQAHHMTVTTMVGTVLERRFIPAGTDLQNLLIELIAKWHANGWTIESFDYKTNYFYCNKESQRLCVGIWNRVGPYEGHSHLMGKSPQTRS
jgi:hypothetical protein